MERMFERDKDDLRSLGIAIELGSFDPLFEDEAGYRISPSSYKLDLGELDGTDIALLSIAASAWTGAALERESTSALIKLASMGLDSDSEALSLLAPRINGTNENFTVITDAIIRRSEIEFEYVSSDLTKQRRKIAPYSLRGQSGSWYLVGQDLEKNSLRTFRLDRLDQLLVTSQTHDLVTTPRGQWFAGSDEQRKVLLQVDPAWLWVLEQYPGVSIGVAPSGQVVQHADWVTVEVGVNTERWMQRLLVRLGAHATVVMPTDWQQLGRDTARLILQRYERTNG
jgi:predicted DNA-binding transcriptional regulator YafY